MGLWVVSAVVGGLGLYVAVCHAHMFLHRVRPNSRTVTVIVRLFLGVVGLSVVRWLDKHNHGHHGHLNDGALDPDLDYQPVMRLHPSQVGRSWMRYQHVYCWVLYPLTMFSMSIATWRLVTLGGDRGGRSCRPAQRIVAVLEIVPGPALTITLLCLRVHHRIIRAV